MSDDASGSGRKTLGRKIMQDVIGPEYFSRREATTNPFNSDLRDLSEKVCFGDIWSRPGLDRKVRSMLCISILTAMGRGEEIKAHVNGALNNGCTREEIKEVILHTTVYCGFPLAQEANRAAEQVLLSRGLLP